jgi:chemotaxis family two-component system response regulator Rcp1
VPKSRKSCVEGNAQILLVEDNPGDIRLVQEAFAENGLSARLNITRDGEQALAFLRREGAYANSPRPALVLLDLNLPRKSGREVLAEIKQEERLRQIPVIILSTSTRAEDIAKAYDLHANCYVVKPVDLDRLVEFGQEIKNFWLCMAALPT